MAKSVTGRLRGLWLNVHLWIGVGLFVALVPLGVTGALLVWDQTLDRALHADRFAVSRTLAELPPSAYLAAGQAAFGDRAVATNLRFPTEAGIPVTVVGRMAGAPAANGRPRQLTAWLDPKTAKVVDVADISQSLFSTLHRLHGSFLIPDIGRKVVGWVGVAMTVSCLTGLWLWWPRSGNPILGLRWLRTPMVFDNLHHLIGFWVCVPLAVVSLTGVYISFPQTSHALFGVAAPQQRPGGAQRGRDQGPPLVQPTTSIDQAVATASDQGGGKLLAITLPTEGGRPSWRVQFKAAKGPDVAIQVVDETGEARPDRGGRDGGAAGRAAGTRAAVPGPDTISPLMRKIHDGGETGLIWQTIIFLAGMAPAVLGVTGIVMWLRGRVRKARLKALRTLPAE